MATKSAIKAAINKRVNDSKTSRPFYLDYRYYYRARNKEEAHSNPQYWQYWEADSLDVARK
jgi:hypothetical protein